MRQRLELVLFMVISTAAEGSANTHRIKYAMCSVACATGHAIKTAKSDTTPVALSRTP